MRVWAAADIWASEGGEQGAEPIVVRGREMTFGGFTSTQVRQTPCQPRNWANFSLL